MISVVPCCQACNIYSNISLANHCQIRICCHIRFQMLGMSIQQGIWLLSKNCWLLHLSQQPCINSTFSHTTKLVTYREITIRGGLTSIRLQMLLLVQQNMPLRLLPLMVHLYSRAYILYRWICWCRTTVMLGLER